MCFDRRHVCEHTLAHLLHHILLSLFSGGLLKEIRALCEGRDLQHVSSVHLSDTKR